MEGFITFDNVTKVYGKGEVRIDALRGVSFSIDKGEFCVILGASGAGKTTLLNILGGMDQLTSGSVFLGGRDVSKMAGRSLTLYRRQAVGFVFQFYNLIPNLTALENVELAAQVGKNPMDARTALELVGLKERMNNFPAQLSGGEQQRVAIARAIAKNPDLLLCDEPTGALDYVTGKAILKLLYQISRERQMTVILITHNQAISRMADRIITINSGRITSDRINENKLEPEQIEW